MTQKFLKATCSVDKDLNVNIVTSEQRPYTSFYQIFPQL